MELDDEGHPVRSPESARSNGRITVTVAAAPPPPQNTLTLALPIQNVKPLAVAGAVTSAAAYGGSGGGGGREDCWSEGATAVLIEAWGERYMELSRGNLKQKHWKEVADIVSSREDYRKTPKTDIQCKNRIDTVKKKYKLEKAKIAAGQGPSKWPFFEKLDQLIGSTVKMSSSVGGSINYANAGPSNLYNNNQNVNVPMGIPMRLHHPLPQQLRPHHEQILPKLKQKFSDSDSESEPELSPDSADSFPPGTFKRPRIASKPPQNWGSSVRELTRAILKFGEAYEQAEGAKLQQIVEMEKQRMKFAKEMELQRMQFFMNTQLELSQLKHRRVVQNHRSSNHNAAAAANHNNSDGSI